MQKSDLFSTVFLDQKLGHKLAQVSVRIIYDQTYTNSKLSKQKVSLPLGSFSIVPETNQSNSDLGTGHKLEGEGGGGRLRAGVFLFWPTSFGETLPIPGAC